MRERNEPRKGMGASKGMGVRKGREARKGTCVGRGMKRGGGLVGLLAREEREREKTGTDKRRDVSQVKGGKSNPIILPFLSFPFLSFPFLSFPFPFLTQGIHMIIILII